METILGSGQFKVGRDTALAKLYSAKEIRLALKKYLKTDTWFINSIRSHILKRLKYATGKLYDSIQFDFDVQIRSRKNGFFITISVILLDTELLPALLSEQEIKQNNIKQEIPTHQELVRYVESKRKYFHNLIKEKREQALHLQRRDLILEYQQSILRTKRHGSFSREFKNPVEEIAREIRRAMRSRASQDKPITRGSTRILLGFAQKPLRHLRQNKNAKAKPDKRYYPFYKTENPPLFTLNDELNDNDMGVINQAIKSMLERFSNQFLSSQMDRLLSHGYTIEDIMETVFNEVPEYNKMVKSFQALTKTLESKTKKLEQTSKRTLGKEGEKHRQATEAVAKSQLKAAEAEYQIYIKNSIPNANAIKKEIDKANAEAKKIAARIIGRQTRMSRGRARDEMFRKRRRLLG